MRQRTFVAAVAVTAVTGGGGLATYALAQSSGPSIDIRKRAIVYGGKIRVTGNTNLGSQAITLQEAVNGGAFADVDTDRSTVDGGYAFDSRKPKAATVYRVVVNVATGPVTTREVPVAVRSKVPIRVSTTRPRKGSRLRFSGLVEPALPGARVFLQRRTSAGAYSTVLESKLTDANGKSPYIFRIRIGRPGTYRVATDGFAGLAAGASVARNIRVRR